MMMMMMITVHHFRLNVRLNSIDSIDIAAEQAALVWACAAKR